MSKYLFWERFAKGKLKTHVSCVKIRVPSPKEILSWSQRYLYNPPRFYRAEPKSIYVGQIYYAHTVEHDTLKPISGGLFCEVAFGPIATNICACGRKNRLFENYCEVCRVQFTTTRLRRYQMGHIVLGAPVIHLWALQGGYVANLLGKKNLAVRSLAYGKALCQSKVWNESPTKRDQVSLFGQDLLLPQTNKFDSSGRAGQTLNLTPQPQPLLHKPLGGVEERTFQAKTWSLKSVRPLHPWRMGWPSTKGTKGCFSCLSCLSSQSTRSKNTHLMKGVKGFQGGQGGNRTHLIESKRVFRKRIELLPPRTQRDYYRENALPFYQFILYKPDHFHKISLFFNSLSRAHITFPLPHYSKQKLVRSFFDYESVVAAPEVPPVSPKVNKFLEALNLMSPLTTSKIHRTQNPIKSYKPIETIKFKGKKILERDGFSYFLNLYKIEEKDIIRNFGVFNQKDSFYWSVVPFAPLQQRWDSFSGNLHPWFTSTDFTKGEATTKVQALGEGSIFGFHEFDPVDLKSQAPLSRQGRTQLNQWARVFMPFLGPKGARSCFSNTFTEDATLRLLKSSTLKPSGEQNIKIVAYTSSSVLFQTLKNLNLFLLEPLTSWKFERYSCKLKNFLLLQDELTKKQRRLRNKLAKAKRVITRRKNLVKSFLTTEQLPEWMIVFILPVLPPALRPILELEENMIVVSDVNELYQFVIRCNDYLSGLLADRALEIDILRTQAGLQEGIEMLFDKGAGTNISPVKSLSQGFHGKRGLFRSHLLGKRVDYSGRSVIVVGPQLKLHECGLPKEMALVLFFPFLIARLKNRKIAFSTSQAKELILNKDKRIWENLKSLIYQHPVLLNRAPTLHRLGFQAFQPILVSGKAIILPALVCTGFNADFDGDQMGVHVPLSHMARSESWKLLYAKNNMLSPATGKGIIGLSQEMILGCYCSSLLLNKTFSSQSVLNFRLPLQRFQTNLNHTLTDFTEGVWPKAQLKQLKQLKQPSQGMENYSRIKEMQVKKRKLGTSIFYFTTFQEVYKCLNQGKITTQTPIWLRMTSFEDNQSLEYPLEIRLNAMGHFFRSYCHSQRHFSKYTKSKNQTKGISYIRTSAGRIQLNEIFYSAWS